MVTEIESFLCDVTRRAGELAMSYVSKPLESRRKADGSLVSEADLAVDAFLKHELHGAFPDYGWLSEESPDDGTRLTKTKVWLVDPIDGTRAFLQGRDDWVISVALVEKGAPTHACLFNPLRQELYVAQKGKGARRNGRPIRVSAQTTIAGCRMLANAGLFRQARWRKAPWPAMRLPRVNAIAYRLALVAAGDADATLSLSKKNDWDLAAASLLVQEAGGCATTAEGKPLRFNRPKPELPGILAAGPTLHAALLAQMRRAGVIPAPAQK